MNVEHVIRQGEHVLLPYIGDPKDDRIKLIRMMLCFTPSERYNMRQVSERLPNSIGQ